MSLALLGFAVIVFLFITAVIMPWVNRSRLQDIEAQLSALKQRLMVLESKAGVQPPPTVAPWQAQAAAQKPVVAAVPTPTPSAAAPVAPMPQPAAAVKQTPVEKKSSVSFEQQFGARLPVWIGGIALILAGLFFVKYSIETGLLSPLVRVVLGGLFGLGMLAAAEKIRAKPGFANGARIAQALSGAGIADLYVCLFAATSLYGLLPNFVGFLGMAAVTATAMVLALRHGMPIALLGMIGGLLTPALVSSNHPNAALLFMYLYAVIAGLMVVVRRKAWWGIAIPTVLGGFGWVGIWLVGGHYNADDAMWLGLFLMATSATYVYLSPRPAAGEVPENFVTLSKVMQYLSLAGAAIMMAFVVGKSGYSMMSLELYGLLILGAMGLAYADQERFGFAPWVAMGVNLLQLIGWNAVDPNLYAVAVAAYATLFIVTGYLQQSRSERPLLWTGLVVASTLSYYLIGYAKLHAVNFGAGIPLLMTIPYFWGVLAWVTGIFSVFTVRQLMRQIPNDHPQKAHVLALYAAQAAAFIAIGLTVELDREFLTVAIALEVLALAWINTRVDIARLRGITAAVVVAFGVLLLPQVLLLVQLTFYSILELQLRLQNGIPIVNWPLFQLGLPAVALLAASYLLRQDKDDRIVRAFEVAAVALVGVMGYYLTRHAFHVNAEVLFVKAGFFERGVITNVLFLYGLLCLFLGQRYGRGAVATSGLVLSAVAIFRIGFFDLLMYNPAWANQSVGELPIVNALLLTFGAPLAWMALLRRDLVALGMIRFATYLGAFMLLVAFALVSLEVCQLFHGDVLNNVRATNAEVYSYSVAWLLLGVTLLLYGTWKGDKMVRVASLILMILTVGKVFLYDAAELEGLFRVFSFFGLGMSLLALSWFYTRYVFKAVK